MLTLEVRALWKTGMRTGLSPVVTLSTDYQQGHAQNIPGCAEQPQGRCLEVPNHGLTRAPAAPWPC